MLQTTEGRDRIQSAWCVARLPCRSRVGPARRPVACRRGRGGEAAACLELRVRVPGPLSVTQIQVTRRCVNRDP